MYESQRINKGQSLFYFSKDYVVIDLETTGFNSLQDEIIEVAGIKYRDNKVVETFASLVKPDNYIPEHITKITGISNEMVETAPNICEVLTNFLEFIGNDILIGHNVNFDINFLYDNSLKFLNKYLTNNFIDTLRIAKKYVTDVENHKLETLSKYFDIDNTNAHRALNDCETTNALYSKLMEIKPSNDENITENFCEKEINEFDDSVLENIDETNPFYKKKLAFKGNLRTYPTKVFEKICNKCGCEFSDIFFSDIDYLIFGHTTYEKNVIRKDYSEKMLKAIKLMEKTELQILSEYEFLDMLGIGYTRKERKKKKYFPQIDIKSMHSNNESFDISHPLYGKTCVFTGTLEKMTRKEAMQKVLDFGGEIGNGVTKKTNFLVLGNNDYCPFIKDGKSSKQKKAEELKIKGEDIEIITENTFYDMLEM